MEEARYEFTSAGLAGVHFAVRAMRFVDTISAPYRAEIEVVTDDRDADLSLMLGKDATLLMSRGGVEHPVRGVAFSVTEHPGAGTDSDAGVAAQVVLMPGLWALALRRNTRMFQEQTVDQILETVLAESLGVYGRSIRNELNVTYEPREYCLQYQETDLHFCQRLMQEEGIHYRFDHLGEQEVMVLADGNDAFADAETVAGALPYNPHELASGGDSEGIKSFQRQLAHQSTAIAIADFDWTLPTMPVTDAQEGEDALGRVRERYEHGEGMSLTIGSYDEGARRYQKQDAARLKVVRQEEVRRDEIVAFGQGRAVGLAAGTVFELVGHPSPEANGRWLITRIQHRDTGGTGPDPYTNHFECIPVDVPYRPRRRVAKPVISSIQTAVVTGPSGEEIHVDEHGRITVRFHWDRENPADETSSCWIRVKQEWAGSGWGIWYVPRIGMEVVVQFIDGDPDRPLVTGCVYNADNTTPYALPDEKTKSTIKSNSSLGGGGNNEFRFEDKAGSEQIFTHAQKDYNEVVENDHNTLVHHDQSNEVDNDQTQTIHNNQVERVDVDQTMSVGGNRTVHVETNYDETIDGTETRTTTGDVTETFDATEDRTIGASVTETIGGNETRTIASNQTETIGAAHTLTVSGNEDITVTGAFSKDVTGGITTITPGSHTSTAAAGWSVSTDAAITFIAAAGATIIAPGGTTRVDFSWTTKAAGSKSTACAVDFEYYALKYAACATVDFSIAGLRFSNTLTEDAITPAYTATKAAATKTGAFINKQRAAVADWRQRLQS